MADLRTSGIIANNFLPFIAAVRRLIGIRKLPPKVRELISQLKTSGFEDRGGKGSHRNFTHPNVVKPITISGKPGDDAKIYQVKAVKKAIEESQQ